MVTARDTITSLMPTFVSRFKYLKILRFYPFGTTTQKPCVGKNLPNMEQPLLMICFLFNTSIQALQARQNPQKEKI